MNATQNSKIKNSAFLLPLLDVLAIAAWGVMMLKYWLTGTLYLLINPNYFWLVILAGFSFLGLSILKGLELLGQYRKGTSGNRTVATEHLSLFPPGWGSGLLLVTAILGLVITPQVFSSQTALDRGVADILTSTRTQSQSFRTGRRPEERSLIDWVRTLSVYPEPDAYTGQKVKVEGFVIHPPEKLSNEYIMIARFVLTCCAADAYPVGMLVKLPQDRSAYPPDTWLEIQGQMITVNLEEKRQIAIEASSLNPIPKPQNPYDY